jgi:hypothetical protein
MFSAARHFLASLFSCMSRAVDDQPTPAPSNGALHELAGSTINLTITVNDGSPSVERRAYSQSPTITHPLAPERHPANPVLHSRTPPGHRRMPHSPASSHLPIPVHREDVAAHEPVYSQIKKGPK